MSEEHTRKMRRLVGPAWNDGSSSATLGSFEYYECSRYVWWNARQESLTKADRKFMSRRMALLYIAKRNSDELLSQAMALGKAWAEATSIARGPYAVEPNRPWDDEFLDLPDAVLEEYGSNCCSVVNMLKPKMGTVYSFNSKSIEVTGAAALSDILSAPWAASSEPEQESQRAEENRTKPVRSGTRISGPYRQMPNGAFAE